jgi:hypothetical protein
MIVTCDKCGKKFNASDAMSGKRVRCRSCGQAITIPGGPEEDAPAPRTMVSQGSKSGTVYADTSPKGASESSKAGTRAGVRQPPVGAREGQAEEPDQEVERDPSIMEGGRFNTLLDFPGSPVIDQVLPIVLLVLSVGWLFAQTMGSNELDKTWVALARVGVFWLLYLAIVFPLARAGSLAGGRKAEVQPPPQHGFRVLSTFAFPSVLAYILWSIVGGVGSVVMALIIGLVVALAAHLLLYRLRPDEGTRALPIVAGWYGGAVVAAALALLALNFGVEQIMIAARNAHEYAESPLGHHLPWNPPPAPVVVDSSPKKVVPPKPIVPTVVETPTTQTVAVAATQETSPVTLPSNAVAVANADPFASTPATPMVTPAPGGVPDPSAVKPTEPAVASLPTTPTDTQLTVQPPRPASDEADVARTSPLVEDAKVLTEVGEFDDAVFPVAGGRAVLLVEHKDQTADDLSVWDTGTLTKVGATTSSREQGAAPQYAVSGDGRYVAWVSTFPTLSIQVYSTAEKRVGVVNLNKSIGTPTVLGFNESGTIWVLWRSATGEGYGLQGLDVKTSATKRQFEMPNYVGGDANHAFSADGKYVAVLRLGPRQSYELTVYALASGQMFRRFPVTGMDAQMKIEPTAITFSPDGQKVATVVERNGQGLIMGFSMPTTDGKPVAQQLFPAGFIGGGPDSPVARVRDRVASFDYLPGNAQWLVYGIGVYGVTGGETVGDLALNNVVAQRVVDATNLELVTRGAPGAPGNDPGKPARCRLLAVKLKARSDAR